MPTRAPAVLQLAVDVDAPVEQTWAAATDWDGQSAWMIGTVVRGTLRDGQGEGAGIEAFTGLTVAGRRLGFLDPMTVTSWQPPHRCDVLHTGRVVRGTGTFVVEPRPGGRSRFVWREDLDLPLGALGRAGWVLVRPAFALGVRLSLRRFARWVESGRSAAAGSGGSAG